MGVEEGRFQGSLRPERWVGLNVSKREGLAVTRWRRVKSDDLRVASAKSKIQGNCKTIH